MRRAGVTLALIAALSFYTSGSTNAEPTPPQIDIRAEAEAEIHHLRDQGLKLPQYDIAVLDRSKAAYSMVSPLTAHIIVWTDYTDRDALHYYVAHEAGHLILYAAGLDWVNEDLANQVAGCFGAETARAYLKRTYQYAPSPAACRELGEQLRK